MTDDHRAQLARILAGFDEPALEALASKGLVRRAKKDLTTEALSHEETDAAVIVRGNGWTVTMPPAGPTAAKDSTHATGITRQILMAVLYLRESFKPTAAVAVPQTVDPLPIVLGITLADLEKWAGKTLVRQALEELPDADSITVESTTDIRITFARHEMMVRFGGGAETTPRKLFDAGLATGPKSQQAFWKIVAVLALHRFHGVRHAAVLSTKAKDPPPPRAEALSRARTLFADIVNTGLVHVSEQTLDRLFTLTLTCQALALPRLARLVRLLADQTDRALRRDVSADTAAFFHSLATADALTQALATAGDTPPITLVGQSRTEYAAVGDLTLQGLGAWPWQTGSGYEGVTALFHDSTGDRFLTVTNSRPTKHTGSRIWEHVYAAEGVWPGGPVFSELARTRFTLRKARINPQGRLSTTKESSVEQAPAPFACPTGRQVFTDWSALAQHTATLYPLGLHLPHPADAYVILRPTVWGERVFVELEQCLRWRIADSAGRTVDLTLPWCGVNEDATAFLEFVNPERDVLDAVVVRATFDRGPLAFEPLALLSRGTPQGDCILCPGFDRQRLDSKEAKQSTLLQRLRAKFGRDRVPTTLADDADESPAALPVGESALAARLRDYGTRLLHRAEAGAGRDGLFAKDRSSDHAFFHSIGLADLGREDPLAAQYRLSLVQTLLGLRQFHTIVSSSPVNH